MKGNPKRPPWSQPLCQACYVERFKVPCRATSPWVTKEHCFDCGEVTEHGIYLDIRPADQRPRGASGRGYAAKDKEVGEWVRVHGEYRRGTVRGSAEDSKPSDAKE